MKGTSHKPKQKISEQKLFEESILQQIAKMEENQRKIWLPIFYDRYTERFFKDNEKIWSIGNIFIPLSLAGLLGLKDASFQHTCLLAFGSIVLMLFWMLISERLRALQTKSNTVCSAIEIYNGICFPKARKNAPAFITKIGIRTVRWLMFLSVITVWTAAIVLSLPKLTVKHTNTHNLKPQKENLVK